MPRVRFIKQFNWDIPGSNRQQSIAYLPGMRELVTTPCAAAAVEAGAAEYVAKFNKGEPALAQPPPDEETAKSPPPVEEAPPRVTAASARSSGKGK
jgi:hypothetical protein